MQHYMGYLPQGGLGISSSFGLVFQTQFLQSLRLYWKHHKTLLIQKFKNTLMTIYIYIRLLYISNMVYFMKKIKRGEKQFSVEIRCLLFCCCCFVFVFFFKVNFIFLIFEFFWSAFSMFIYFYLLFLFSYFSVIIRWIEMFL